MITINFMDKQQIGVNFRLPDRNISGNHIEGTIQMDAKDIYILEISHLFSILSELLLMHSF
jgi:hypothetical protein